MSIPLTCSTALVLTAVTRPSTAGASQRKGPRITEPTRRAVGMNVDEISGDRFDKKKGSGVAPCAPPNQSRGGFRSIREERENPIVASHRNLGFAMIRKGETLLWGFAKPP